MASDRRPDPDALLQAVTKRDQPSGRGRLRIYLGANAGVGKTYAMLAWAHQRLRQGVDVIAGFVETHGRRETEALSEGIPSLPRRTVLHRGVPLVDFDLDAALQRRPGLILVDEMAHENAPGSRHDKRWLDIRELVESGISVATTLNVQHLESLNDVVIRATGVRVHETVPDSAVEEADEVILVDVPPEELMQRFREGKVYPGAQAQEAMTRFFQPIHLLALRELALRFVAEQVGAEVEVQRHASPDRATWPIRERLLVAVGPSPSSAKLVRSTRRLAVALDAPWIAVSVHVPGQTESPIVRAQLAQHLNLAQSLGAQVIQTSGTDVAEEILRLSREHNVTKIVVGKPISNMWKEMFRPSPVDRLIRKSGDIDIYVMTGDPEAGFHPPPATAPNRDREAYGIAVLSVVTAGFLVSTLGVWVQPEEAVMVFLSAITVTATFDSRRATLLGCILAVLAYNVLVVPPLHSLLVESPRHLPTLGGLFLVGLLISTLTHHLCVRATLARDSERKTAVLARLGDRLAAARGAEAILHTAMEEIASAFGSQVVLYLPQPGGRVRYAGGVPSAVPADDKETAVAQWVFDHGRQAGHGTDTLQAATFLHFPVAAHGQKTHAVLGLYPPEATAPLDSEQRIVLNSLVSQTALALEVDTLEAERQRSESRILSELFRHWILSSVSHELRTPMASILGCASSLLDKNQSPDQGHQEDLLKTIRGEALHMDGLVTRLLDMTRFETLSALKAQSAKARAEGPESSDLRDREPGQGVPSSPGVQLRLADLPVDALIGSALTRLRQKLRGRGVETSVDPATPPVHADEVFVRLVLLNLLENGIKDSPPHSPLSVRAFPDGKWVRIEVADRGHGLQPEECDLVFGKVFRDGASQATRGAGLGLAIAQFIVRAHHGSISASNRPGGGTVFSFTLPAGNAAAQAPETALP